MRKSGSGYTLIEILISLTIISSLFGAGFVGFRQFARRQQLVSQIRGLNADLNLAQGRAFAGNKPSGCDTLVGYSLDFNNTGYLVEAVCVNGNYEVRTVVLPTSTELSSTIPSLLFKPIGQGTDIPQGEVLEVSITQTQLGTTSILSISETGEISQGDRE